MTRSLLTLTLLTSIYGCAQDSELAVPADFELQSLAGKADALDCNLVHESSQDISVLKAQTLGRIAPGSNTVTANYNVDVSECTVLAEQPGGGYDCQFYDDCKDMTVDCTDAITAETGLTTISEATFRVRYTKRTNPSGETAERYLSENFNCQQLEITTVTRTDALPFASGIGFYYDGHTAFVPASELEAIEEVTLANGESGTVHQFGGLTLCWAGSMSSSMSQVTNFKPFVVYEAGDTCYVGWDSVPENYRITVSTRFFDRSPELLQ